VFFELRAVELSDVPFEDQVHALVRCGVLVGAHGGGLAGQAWMEPGGRSAVVEVLHNVVGARPCTEGLRTHATHEAGTRTSCK
jgi:hypothetical protein